MEVKTRMNLLGWNRTGVKQKYTSRVLVSLTPDIFAKIQKVH